MRMLLRFACALLAGVAAGYAAELVRPRRRPPTSYTPPLPRSGDAVVTTQASQTPMADRPGAAAVPQEA
ncbi:MAG: hypothetical protein M3Q27_03645 [Actinomycetota bacterium]|nr:hypothetical protein [Actinomycetota bacterium]